MRVDGATGVEGVWFGFLGFRGFWGGLSRGGLVAKSTTGGSSGGRYKDCQLGCVALCLSRS